MTYKRLALALLCLFSIGLVAGCTPKPAPPTPVDTAIVLYAYDTEKDEALTLHETLSLSHPLDAATVATAYQDYVMSAYYHKVVNLEVTQEGDVLRVDFNQDDIETLGLGSGSEAYFFNDLARSLGQNLSDIKTIYYGMNGSDFATGHLWYAKDDPFWIRE